MSIASAGAIAGIASAGVGAAGAAGAFGGPAVAGAGETESQLLQDQANMVGQLATVNAHWDPYENATAQNIAETNLFGSAGSPATGASTVWIGPNGQQQSTPPMVNETNPAYNASAGGGKIPNNTPPTLSVIAPGWNKQTTAASPGSPAVAGLLPELGAAMPVLNNLQNQLAQSTATAQIGEVADLGPSALSAIKAFNPGATDLSDTLLNQANQQLATDGGLTPGQQRQFQQQVRGSQAARGLGNGSGDAAQEANFLFNNQQAIRQQNQALASGVLGQQQQEYGDPFMSILGRSSGMTVPGPNTNNTGPVALSTQEGQAALNALGQQEAGAQNQSNVGAYNTQMEGLGALTGQSNNIANLFGSFLPSSANSAANDPWSFLDEEQSSGQLAA